MSDQSDVQPPAEPAQPAVTIVPIHDRILVKRDPTAEKIGSIHLPETSKEKPRTGTIIAVGDGVLNPYTGERYPLSLKLGDRVVFSTYAGTEVQESDQDLVLMSEADVLAVIVATLKG